MPEQIVNYNEIRFNNTEDGSIAASTITANYQTVLDLLTGEDYNAKGTKNTLSIQNTLNKDVMLAIVGVASTATRIISANTDYTWDKFVHWGKLMVKAQSALPSSGNLIISSW